MDIYVPAPWWKTEIFEIRYEDLNQSKKYYFKWEGDGLRYELSEFLSLIRSQAKESYKLTRQESILINTLIEEIRAANKKEGINEGTAHNE